MRSSRRAVSAAVLTATLALAACTGGSGTKTESKSTTPPVTTTTTASPSSKPATPPPTTPKPTPAKTVPVDQIPPGNPASWVPAGVPTTAKYKEPGDVVPRFTQAMFKNTYDGALSVMVYYFDAVNWDAATGYTPQAFTIVCPLACAQDARNSRSRRILGQHLSGGRFTVGGPTIARGTSNHNADWVGQFNVTVKPGKLIDRNGKKIDTYPQTKLKLALGVRYTGKIWNVVGIYFVQ